MAEPTGGRTPLWWTVTGSIAVALLTLALVVVVADRNDHGADDQLVAQTPGSATSPPISTEAPSDSTTTVPEHPAAACPADALTDRQKLGQLIMVGVDPTGTVHAQEVVEAHHVGGIFVGGDDTTLIASGTLADLAGPTGIAPFVAVDDEGGRVQRMATLAGDLPSARRMASELSLHEITRLAQERGNQLLDYGINVDFAPVLDVSDQSAGEVIGDRSFGSDPETVVRNAEAFATGLEAAGVLAVYKHFPGHGHALGDSHLGASEAPPLDSLGPDLAPFEALINRDPSATAVMVGHLTVPGLTDGEPATISPEAINGLLRDDMGYDGLVFTDELGAMKAISARHQPADAARLALLAGADVALFAHPADASKLLDDLAAYVSSGDLPQEVVDAALARVLRAKGHGCG